ncbi:MAG: UDP-2,3-diacylglucosamine diphosphatase LpxI [Planctomycetes bacterium]|nr:UDP-2,3-diacylglucosamine diphosphatase LpxI [Planctomycetota bacterium]
MSEHRKIGLVAGWGRFPQVVAEALKRQGRRVVGLGIKDHVEPETAALCDVYHEVGLARLGAALRYFRRHGVTQATMAGKIHKVRLFQRFHWIKHIPDGRCVRTFFPHFAARTKDRRDDTLLLAVVEAFAEDGIHFAPATDFAPELLVKDGLMAGRRLSRAQQQDIAFGWRIAKELGRLDCGQSVAVKGRAVLALEAVEGTDECIRRAGRLCTEGGFTVVKVAKPQQDMRFDVPTIGVGTIETLAQAGGRVLAVEAGKTILIDEAEVAALARRHKISVVALHDPAAEVAADAA